MTFPRPGDPTTVERRLKENNNAGSHPTWNLKPARPAATPTPWPRHALTLLVFALTFITLEVVSYTRESATWDEPIHVMDGYASLAQHDYRVDVEHPPLLRMWAVLPLLRERIAVNTRAIDGG